MSTRETMRQLAAQEAVRSNTNAQNQGSEGQMLEKLEEILKQQIETQKRLDHIEKNLILQQPDVVEFTKKVYPYLEAAVKRCEKVEKRLSDLEKLLAEYEAHMDQNWQATDAIVEKQKTDFGAISKHFQGRALKDLQGYYQQIHTELEKMTQIEITCLEVVEECRTLAQQCGQTYETSSKTIEELAETSKKHVTEVKNKSLEVIKESSERYVQMFRRLTWLVGGQPIASIMTVLITVVLLSMGTSILLNRTLTNWTITKSVEASTQSMQETLQPIIEKIEKQTQNLNTVYEQSEAFDYYIETLPVRERMNKRSELIEGLRKEKLKEAERYWQRPME